MSSDADTLDPRLQVKLAPLLMMVRDKALRRGPEGFQALARVLGVRTANDDVKLMPEKFRQCIKEFGIVLTQEEVTLLTQGFRDGQGYIRCSAFCTRVASIMGGARRAFVERVFDQLDVNGSGAIDATDLRELADFSQNSHVRKGIITEEEAIRQYLDAFDVTNTPDGMITRDEFLTYYAGISAELAEDAQFFEIVKSAWTFPTKTGAKFSLSIDPRSGANSSANADGTVNATPGINNFKGTLGGIPARSVVTQTELDGFAPPKRIVGYTGHVPLASERFGETFHNIEVSTPALPRPKYTTTDTAGQRAYDESKAFVRQGNKANNHSYRLA